MGHLERFLKSAVTWTSTIGGVIGLAFVFVPGLRAVADRNGLLGWLLAVICLTAVIVVLELTESARTRAKALESELVAAVATSAAEQRARDLSKDIALIDERLQGMTLDSELFDFLVNHADFNRFPVRHSRDLDARRERWEIDPRVVADAELAAAWQEVEDATSDFARALGNLMWTKGREPGGTPQHDVLDVPREWPFERRDAAVDTLTEGRRRLVAALRDMYALHQSRR
ncbi:hypothetical protein MHY85_10425 [Cellulomonas sp. ACRRI]|uniref:hypothetical protein n=1 Tax=Cellulomonas sp. ACRRI TaxID=2918188 RepID=UPI001EF344C8|nr:hypothetical protein [Cellulomonas sp. ACRRI]MCG7286383.1 hypothetical protein [Cellulomonas sp. ACRRI]